jgi:hypothetical protein
MPWAVHRAVWVKTGLTVPQQSGRSSKVGRLCLDPIAVRNQSHMIHSERIELSSCQGLRDKPGVLGIPSTCASGVLGN